PARSPLLPPLVGTSAPVAPLRMTRWGAAHPLRRGSCRGQRRPLREEPSGTFSARAKSADGSLPARVALSARTAPAAQVQITVTAQAMHTSNAAESRALFCWHGRFSREQCSQESRLGRLARRRGRD